MKLDPLVSQAITTSRILIIDDQELCVRQLSRILKDDGYTDLVECTDPQEAVDKFSAVAPDLMLLDWHMEPLTGLQILEQIRLQQGGNMPPVIVLTGDSYPETKRIALAAGASDFLTKPIDPVEALLRIRNILRVHLLHRRVETENNRLEDLVKKRTAKLTESINELKVIRRQVIGEERMRALSMMAGGVAHDFNNALTIIRGYSELALLSAKEAGIPGEMVKALETIGLAAKDAAEIVRRLRQFSHPFSNSDGEYQMLELNGLITEAIELARPKWETQTRANGVCVTIETQLEELPKQSMSGAEMREVIINLLFNAVDAMPQGGPIAVRTRRVDDSSVLEIEDSGTGMTEETRLRCLEPFYTTKGENGTGLGLAIIFGIVRRLGGEIKIQSQLNVGTKVTLTLPLHQNGEAINDVKSKPIAKNLKVLIVDDDPGICSIVKRFLEEDHHIVTSACNGCEALEKFYGQVFDVVITDRVMPKMSGDQLAAAIHQICPEVPIILLTGFEAKKKTSDVKLCLTKPVSMDIIRDALTAVVAA